MASGFKFHLDRKNILVLAGFFLDLLYVFLFCVFKFIKFRAFIRFMLKQLLNAPSGSERI